MKTHTSDFKNNVKLFGRELDSIISYTLENEDIELGNENLNSVSPHYEGGILKSVMRQLDIDCDREIPEGTELNYQFGVKVRDEEVEDYRDNYDYVDFGNYIVYKTEKQEDTNSWKIICYDKMLYSMKDYESMGITYPITIRNYINTICQHLGLTFKNANDIFANYNRNIPNEKYLDGNNNSLGYTFRDVLDELAQVTASTICINEDDDQLEIRYINNTNDTIDGEYLKDINVNFGERYGAINTIVLSRSAGSDNIYYPSVLPENPIEIKISDNQIMNGNDRADYLPDIYTRLNGLQYYLNDFASTGICYYNLCDKYNIDIDGNTYSCIMFNDEVNITQGLEENIHTDMPEEAETDYTKADKTDRRINQTYLIVDKQNQTIESVVNNVTEQNDKISQISQTVDEINSKISDVIDITVTAEDTDAQIELEDINESEPIQLKIHPVGVNISLDYPHNDYPQNDYSKIRILRFIRTYVEDGVTKTQNIDYELPDDLLYYNQDIYDEFYLDYDSQTCQITKKCKWNADGTVGLLSSTQITSYPYPTILLGSGNYSVSILSYDYGYIFARLMAQNIYTTQFYTKAETNSLINQTESSINLEVDEKLTRYDTIDDINAKLSLKVGINDNNQVVSMINASADEITLNSNRFSWNSTNSSMTSNGELTANKGKIANMEMKNNEFYLPITSDYEYTQTDLTRIQNIIAGSITPTSQDYAKYDLNEDDRITIADLILVRNVMLAGITPSTPGALKFIADKTRSGLQIYGGNGAKYVDINFGGITLTNEQGAETQITAGSIYLEDSNGNTKTITPTN